MNLKINKHAPTVFVMLCTKLQPINNILHSKYSKIDGMFSPRYPLLFCTQLPTCPIV